MRRPEHVAVVAMLERMDAELLVRCRCLFGGGTRMTLDLDEYRVSADLDFMVCDADGYARLRSLVRERGPAALFSRGGELRFPREPVTDQYGIRFPAVLPGAHPLKVEVVREARIELGAGERPAWSPVDCLSRRDAVAEKLLANSDRWLDASVLSRDLLDLAAAREAWGPLPASAFANAARAYGDATSSDLARAASRFLDPEQAGHRERCLRGLSIEAPDRLLDAVRRIAAEFPLPG